MAVRHLLEEVNERSGRRAETSWEAHDALSHPAVEGVCVRSHTLKIRVIAPMNTEGMTGTPESSAGPGDRFEVLSVATTKPLIISPF